MPVGFVFVFALCTVIEIGSNCYIALAKFLGKGSDTIWTLSSFRIMDHCGGA